MSKPIVCASDAPAAEDYKTCEIEERGWVDKLSQSQALRCPEIWNF